MIRRVLTAVLAVFISIATPYTLNAQETDSRKDFKRLAYVKELLQRNDPRYLKEYDNLLNQSERIISQLKLRTEGFRPTRDGGKTVPYGEGWTVTTRAAYSVLDKDRIASSGDKNDYFSIPPYFRPNPNTADGLPWLGVDGVVNPGNRYGTDRNSFQKVAEGVTTLSLAYYLTEKQRYSWFASHLIRTWFLDEVTGVNPNMDYSQRAPGADYGSGRGTIEYQNIPAILDSIRLLSYGENSAWNDYDTRRMKRWCTSYLNWLLESKIGKNLQSNKEPKNIQSWYYAQVLSLADFLDRPALVRETADKVKSLLIETQIDHRGAQIHELQRTKSFQYSMFNIRALMASAIVAQEYGIDIWNYENSRGGSIRKAIEYLLPYTDPSKVWPHLDISWKYEQKMSDLIKILARANREWDYSYPEAWTLKHEYKLQNRASLFYRR